jgi:hypothetical protein
MNLHPEEQAVVNDYQQAFLSCYPQRNLTIKPAGRDQLTRNPRFRIIIDGDAGDPLSIMQMLSAIPDFTKGRSRA